MNILKQFFNKSLDNKFESKQATLELKEFVKDRGHLEHFCLDKKYSINSLIPCVDFSTWLYPQIKAKNINHILTLLFQFSNTSNNSNININNKAFVEYIFNYPFENIFPNFPEQTYIELRTVFILSRIWNKNNFDGYIITTDIPKYFSISMLPYNFKPFNIDVFVKQANMFILARREEKNTFWDNIPLYTTESISDIIFPSEPYFKDFQNKFKLLPLNTRAHFFDILQYYNYNIKSNLRPLSELTLYETRKKGIDINESSEYLLTSNLFIRNKELSVFLKNKTKEEIITILDESKIDYKKSWDKQKLINLAIEKCNNKVIEMSYNTIIADIKPEYTETIKTLYNHLEKIILFYQIWLGFGFENINKHTE